MKIKGSKKRKLVTALLHLEEKKLTLQEEKNVLENEIKEIDRRVILACNKIEIDIIERKNGAGIFRLMKPSSSSWDIDKLLKYLYKKHGSIVAKSIVRMKITKEKVVNDELIDSMVQDGNLTLEELEPYITIKMVKPYIRLYKNNDQTKGT